MIDCFDLSQPKCILMLIIREKKIKINKKLQVMASILLS